MTKAKKSISDKLILTVKPRKVFGKKIKQLRKQGLVVGNIFGQEFKSQAITAEFKEFIKIYRIAKETKIVYLKLDKDEIPVLIQNLQKHPVNDLILHVDFRKVDLSKKIETKVPIKIIGVSEAVAQKGGVLLTQTNELTVEAQPENIPSQIEADISSLKEINQEIKVSDLPKNPTYSINELPEKVIVSVVAHKEEAIVPEITTTAPEIITEKPETTEGGTAKEPAKEPLPEKGKPVTAEKSKTPESDKKEGKHVIK